MVLYDAWGRRVICEEFTYGVLASRTLYLYDGWNVIGEFDQVQTLTRRYLWGIDLSGTLQGAGGVGGLAAVELVGEGTYLPACDGHGNVTSYVDSGDGTEVATFEYGPFGELLRSTGAKADLLSYRFSTKPSEGDLYYYGYRYYDPSTGRWPSRDPIGERGGLNLYGFVGNDPSNHYDFLGESSRKYIPLSGGWKLAIDTFNKGSRQASFQIHVYYNNVEMAVVNAQGGFSKRHKGKNLLKPEQLPRSVRNAITSHRKKYFKMIIPRTTILTTAPLGLYFWETMDAEGAPPRSVPPSHQRLPQMVPEQRAPQPPPEQGCRLTGKTRFRNETVCTYFCSDGNRYTVEQACGTRCPKQRDSPDGLEPFNSY